LSLHIKYKIAFVIFECRDPPAANESIALNAVSSGPDTEVFLFFVAVSNDADVDGSSVEGILSDSVSVSVLFGE